MSGETLSFRFGNNTIPVEFYDEDFSSVGKRISELFGGPEPQALLLTDERVALHYAEAVRDSLEAAGMRTNIHSIPPGEQEKSWERAQSVLNVLATGEFERGDVIVALGGGVVNDLAGFVASVYLRGIAWIALPTSLLAMVDASIGGKTGVNHPLGKNLLGAFYPPRAVYAHLPALRTLEPREMRAGSAEVVKHGLLTGGRLWERIVELGPDLNAWSEGTRTELIPEIAKVKIDVVSDDPREADRRRLLNLGHSFGHAIESALGYAGVTHGEAVFLGLRAMLRLSERTGLLDGVAAMELDATLRRAKLPKLELLPEQLLAALAHDKKTSAKKLNWVLLRGAGDPVITADVARTEVEAVAEWLCVAAADGLLAELPRGRARILVVNGANLNMFGVREPAIYGSKSYAELEGEIQAAATELGCEVLIRQSNSEGELVSLIHSCRHWADGIVINPGSYTHTSVAIRDALAAVQIPAIEVHVSDITQREEFRRVSLIAPVCHASIIGKGFAGYREAVEQLNSMFIRGN